MPFFGLIFPFLAKSLFRGVKAKHPPPIPLPSHGIMFGDNVFIAVCKDERFFETERVQFSSKTFMHVLLSFGSPFLFSAAMTYFPRLF
jgi:hypothetical protein